MCVLHARIVVLFIFLGFSLYLNCKQLCTEHFCHREEHFICVFINLLSPTHILLKCWYCFLLCFQKLNRKRDKCKSLVPQLQTKLLTSENTTFLKIKIFWFVIPCHSPSNTVSHSRRLHLKQECYESLQYCIAFMFQNSVI